METADFLPSDADVAFFERNGYWVSGKVIEDGRLAELCRAMDEVYAGFHETGREPWSASWKPGDDPAAIRKTDNAHWANHTIRGLALDGTIGAMAARLMKTDEVRLWHDQLLYKPGQGAGGADRGGNVGWHQDRHYWQCTTADLITAWVPFVDVDAEIGCLRVIPGSHEWGLLDDSDFFNTDLDTMGQRIREATGRPFEPVSLEMRAGQVSFHHCLTIHGSGPNRTDRPRRSLAIHLMPEHAHYVAGTPSDPHMNVILLKRRGGQPGDRFSGDAWPVLYKAS